MNTFSPPAEPPAPDAYALERQLEAFRLVLTTLLDRPDQERAAHLVELTLMTSRRAARELLGLPPDQALPANDAIAAGITDRC